MTDSDQPTRDMITSIAAQLMILYDDAMSKKNKDAARAYATAINVVRNQTKGVKITFNGPPPTLRSIPRISFPKELESRLSPKHRPQ